MKIPSDLTPYEFITGIQSHRRGILKQNHYEIPDDIYQRMVDEIKETLEEVQNKVNEASKI